MSLNVRGSEKLGRNLNFISYACIALGFFIPLGASHWVGMPLDKAPVVSASTIVLWAAGLVLAYLAFARGKSAAAASLAWIKVSRFIASDSSLFLLLGVLFGYLFYPSVEKSLIASWGPYFLMTSLFVMGLAINMQDWLGIIRSPRAIGIAVLIRWACMPLAAYLVSYVVFIQLLPGQTAKTLAIGMILLGTTPTGTASNTLTMISRGDLVLSVSVTTVNTLLAPFLQPVLILWLVGSMASVNTGAIFRDLLQMVIVPVAAGSILGSIFPGYVKRIMPALGPIAIICLGLVIMGSMAKGTSTLIKQLYILFYLFAACLIYGLIGLSIGYFLPKFFRFNLKQRKAACFEVGIENATLTMTLALKHFSPLAALVPILYGKVQNILAATIFVPLFQKMKDDEPVTPPTRRSD